MARFQKFYSTYIRSSKHRNVSNGTIWERDWTTLGERHKMEPGKVSYYGYSNFIFTENGIANPPTKRKNGKWVAHLTYDDVKDSTSTVNVVKLNIVSKDLTDYAYYGSATELIRTSVENIVRHFPGRISIDNNSYKVYNPQSGQYEPIGMYRISNPFYIDFINTDPNIDYYDEIMRYLAYSYQSFDVTIKDNSKMDECNDGLCYEHIVGYTVTDEHATDYGFESTTVLNGIIYGLKGNTYYRYNKGKGVFEKVSSFNSSRYFCCMPGCDYVSGTSSEDYMCISDDGSGEEIPYRPTGKCINNGDVLYTIVITTDGNCNDSSDSGNGSSNDNFRKVKIEARYYDGEVIWLCDTPDIYIQPNKDVIDDYFDSISGFERQLLITDTNPKYSNTFRTPYVDKDGFYKYAEKRYTWPSNGYCIDIESTSYIDFINSMTNLGEMYDELWCDNIFRNMTHEAIKNFDWSYSRHYNEGDEVENIIGGNRMKDILRLYGRWFDDVRYYINGIANSNKITYDGYCNTTLAEISDKCQLNGFDMFSTIWQPYKYVKVKDGEKVPSTAVKMLTLPPTVDSESPEYVCLSCPEPNGDCDDSGSGDSSDNEEAVCYKKITNNPNDISLSCEFLLQTQDLYISKICNWINDPNEGTGYYYKQSSYNPKKKYTELVDFPGYCTSETPKNICVYNNGKRFYFEKASLADSCDESIHDKWYGAMRYDTITPVSADIEFAKRLYLSSSEILRSKGTVHAIEMVMGLFGFGKDIDYKCTEYYRTVTPKIDEAFYYYEPDPDFDESQVVCGSSDDSESDSEDSHDNSYDDSSEESYGCIPLYSSVPVDNINGNSNTVIRVGTESDYTIYVLKSIDNLSEAITEANNDKIYEKYYADDFSGIPVADLFLNDNSRYIIPYYSQLRSYDGDFVFQSNGGWGKKSLDPVRSFDFDYMETVSYLNVLQSIPDLFRESAMSTRDGDIYYVIRVSDYADYFGSVPENLSHFFKLVHSHSPYNPSSWENIPLAGAVTYPNYQPSYGSSVTYNDYRKALYLNSIITKNGINDPHVGYGIYDKGEEFFEYMKEPFKYTLSHSGFTTDKTTSIAKTVKFNVSNDITDNDKIKVLTDKFEYYRIYANELPEDIEWNTGNEFSDYSFIEDDNINISSPLFVKVGDEFYKKKTVVNDNNRKKYYLNSKVLVFENLLKEEDNPGIENYKGYFMDVIAKYLLQVIPSTTILMFKNFDTHATDVEEFTITTDLCTDCDGLGTLTGSGVYMRCSTATIVATPTSSSSKFLYWIDDEGNKITTPSHTIKNIRRDMHFTAYFAEDCQLTFNSDAGISIILKNINGNIVESGLRKDDVLNGTYNIFTDGDAILTLEYQISNTAKYDFEGWLIGNDTNNQQQIIISIPGDCGKSIKAKCKIKEFEIEYRLNVDEYCGKVISLSRTREYVKYGESTSVYIDNDPTNNCCKFVKWIDQNGMTVSTYESLNAIVYNNNIYTAVYTRNSHSITINTDNPAQGGFSINGQTYYNEIIKNIPCGEKLCITALSKPCYKLYQWVVVDHYGQSDTYVAQTLCLDDINSDYSVKVSFVCDCEPIKFLNDALYVKNDDEKLNPEDYEDLTGIYQNINEYEKSTEYENRSEHIRFDDNYYDLISASTILINGDPLTNNTYNLTCNAENFGTHCDCGNDVNVSITQNMPNMFEYVGLFDETDGLWISSQHECCELIYEYVLKGDMSECTECNTYSSLPTATAFSPDCVIVNKECYIKTSTPTCSSTYLPIDYDSSLKSVFDKYGIDLNTLSPMSKNEFMETLSAIIPCEDAADDRRFLCVQEDSGELSYYQFVMNCTEECKICIECGHTYSTNFNYCLKYEKEDNPSAPIEQYTTVEYQTIDDYLNHNPYNADSPKYLIIATEGENEEHEGYVYYKLINTCSTTRTVYIATKTGESISFYVNGQQLTDITYTHEGYVGDCGGVLQTHPYYSYKLPANESIEIQSEVEGWCQFANQTDFINGCSGSISGNDDCLSFTLFPSIDTVFLHNNVASCHNNNCQEV